MSHRSDVDMSEEYIASVGGTHFLQSVGDLVLFCDVSSVEWRVMILLYDVEYRHCVTSREQLFNNVSAHETTATENDVDVAGTSLRYHDGTCYN